jgi:hypothetical protein
MHVQVPATSQHRDITAGEKSPKVVPPKHLQTWRLGQHLKSPKGPTRLSLQFFKKNLDGAGE